jgi:hypothetical protein
MKIIRKQGKRQSQERYVTPRERERERDLTVVPKGGPESVIHSSHVLIGSQIILEISTVIFE